MAQANLLSIKHAAHQTRCGWREGIQMRLFILVFNLVVGAALSSVTTDSSAVAELKKIKPRESNTQKATIQHPFKKHKTAFAVLQPKPVHHPGDVWERIRMGMQLHSLADKFIFQTKGTITLETAAFDISPLLKFSPVQARLYKLQRNNIAALKDILRHPAVPAIHQAAEWHTAENTAKQRASVVQCPDEMPGAIADARLETQPLPTNFIHASFVQTHFHAPTKSSKRVCKTVTKQPTPRVKKNMLPQNQPPKAPGFSQPKTPHERVSKQITWFTQRPAYLQAVAERARPYIYHIVEELSRHKLPLELALLPIVESAYKSTAQSPMRAAGLWQFIPSTGRAFNLKQNEGYDGRLDVTASTQAAIHFLSHLNQHFKGDWLLALAAYNCGAGNVDAAIKRNIAKGLPTDYWSLTLPEETQNYVPRLLALAAIFADPAQYQVHVAPVKNEPYFVKVNIDVTHMNKELSAVAAMADMTYEQFNRLNPGYLSKTLAGHGPFSFILPIANAHLLQQKLYGVAGVAPDHAVTLPLLSAQVNAVFDTTPVALDKMLPAKQRMI